MDEMLVHYFVIFGAAVKPDGKPSGTLKRRVQGAWQLAKQYDTSRFIVTGGQGKHGPSEGLVMKQLLLDMGADDSRILVEDQAQDTLQSVMYCTDILSQQNDNARKVIVCSSSYHNYRCQMLFRMWGVPCRRGKMPSDRAALGTAKWLYYYFREAVAIPWDFLHIGLLRLLRSRTRKKGD
jgi:vancomycin permeability regulator SanA